MRVHGAHVQPLKPGQRRVPKSRYDSVDMYLSLDPANRPEYNDNDLPVNEKLRDIMVEEGMSPPPTCMLH